MTPGRAWWAIDPDPAWTADVANPCGGWVVELGPEEGEPAQLKKRKTATGKALGAIAAAAAAALSA